MRPDAARWDGVASGDLVVEVCDGGGGGGGGGGGADADPDADAPDAGRAVRVARTATFPSVRVADAAARAPPRLDLYHSSGYPAGFFAADDLGAAQRRGEPMDGRGDHPHQLPRPRARAAGARLPPREAARRVDRIRRGRGRRAAAAGRGGALGGQAARRRGDAWARAARGGWHDAALMAQLDYADERTGESHRRGAAGANAGTQRTLAPLGFGFGVGATNGAASCCAARASRCARARPSPPRPRAPSSRAPRRRASSTPRRGRRLERRAAAQRSAWQRSAWWRRRPRRRRAATAAAATAARGWVLALADATCPDDDDDGDGGGDAAGGAEAAAAEAAAADGAAADGAGGTDAVGSLLAQLLSSPLRGVAAAQASLLGGGAAVAPRRRSARAHPRTAPQRRADARVPSVVARVGGAPQLTRQSRECTLPLVAPPAWREPRASDAELAAAAADRASVARALRPPVPAATAALGGAERDVLVLCLQAALLVAASAPSARAG